MSLQFSNRTSWDLRESTYAAAVREARAAGSVAGQRLIDLTVSNPTVCGLAYDSPAILGALHAPESMVYDADPRGLRAAREAIAGYYAGHGASIDPDALLLTTSTSEAYGYLFRLLCNAGDEVLVAQPSYPLFDFLADLEDVRLKPYPLFYDYGWWIDFAELERRIGPRTKAILIVHPNNPTGHWTSKAERMQLRRLCAQQGLALIVDEVFLDYGLVDSEHGVSFAAEQPDELTFILSGMSKIAGLPQMKLAWILTLAASDTRRREALGRLEVIADTFLSVNAPMQHALAPWLASRSGIQGQILKRVRANLKAAECSGVPVLRTEAGWSAILRVGLSAEELVSHHGVIVHPGSFYGITERRRIVVSLLTRELDFLEGMERLRQLETAP